MNWSHACCCDSVGPQGACCFPSGTCKIATQKWCLANGGKSWDLNISCIPNPCPQPPECPTCADYNLPLSDLSLTASLGEEDFWKWWFNGFYCVPECGIVTVPADGESISLPNQNRGYWISNPPPGQYAPGCGDWSATYPWGALQSNRWLPTWPPPHELDICNQFIWDDAKTFNEPDPGDCPNFSDLIIGIVQVACYMTNELSATPGLPFTTLDCWARLGIYPHPDFAAQFLTIEIPSDTATHPMVTLNHTEDQTWTLGDCPEFGKIEEVNITRNFTVEIG